MRRLAYALSLVLLLLVPLAAAATVSQPRWQLGDEWTYAITLVENGEVVQTGDRHVVVTARGAYAYQGASREAVTLTTWQNMSGDPGHSYDDIRDVATGALLATRSGGQTFTAVEPCGDIQYPLSYPKGWSTSCDLGFGPVETTYMVAGEERLTLPAGTYDALSVDAIGNDAVRYWFADAGCGKVAEFSQTNDLQTYVNLTSVKCTPVSTTAPTSTPSGATPPTATTTPRATPTATPTTSRYDYGCPPGTSHDNGSCLTSDADRDGSPLALEQSRGTDPNDADTDNDGVRDNDDKAPLTAGANDNTSANRTSSSTDTPGVGPGALILAVSVIALALRRKAS